MRALSCSTHGKGSFDMISLDLVACDHGQQSFGKRTSASPQPRLRCMSHYLSMWSNLCAVDVHNQAKKGTGLGLAEMRACHAHIIRQHSVCTCDSLFVSELLGLTRQSSDQITAFETPCASVEACDHDVQFNASSSCLSLRFIAGQK